MIGAARADLTAEEEEAVMEAIYAFLGDSYNEGDLDE